MQYLVPGALRRVLGVVFVVMGLLPLQALGDERGALRESALASINPHLLKAHVQFLSHDLLEGRNIGERGFEIAREYVASQFVRMGVEGVSQNNYLQRFEVLVGGEDRGSRLSVSGLTVHAPDAAFAPDWTARQPVISGEGVYVGQGLVAAGRDDYAGVDVRDKIVFLIPGVPTDWEDDPELGRLARTKTLTALKRGARGVVQLQPNSTKPPGRSRPMVLADGSAPSPRSVVTLGGEASAALLSAWQIDPAQAEELAAGGMPAQTVGPVVISRARNISREVSWNVIGIVPGSDPLLRDEAVVLTAHLDHVGMGEADESGDRIYNGTHDNALGIARLLAAAEAIVRAPARRTTIFVAVGAEERGLLGSWYYAKNPYIPMQRTVAALNQDGGLEDAATDDFFAFGVEVTTLDSVLERAAAATGMTLNRDYRSPFAASQALLFRSDQYAFLAAGVPAVYLMDGFTIDGDPERGRLMWDYYLSNVNHQQKDNFDPGWSFESPVRMTKLAVRAAWLLGDTDNPPMMKPNDWFPTQRGVPDH